MKYILCDIDGTVADSSHRYTKLPAYMGKPVTAAIDRGIVRKGMKGHVLARIEREDYANPFVNVRWDCPSGLSEIVGHLDQPYTWEDFLAVTGQDFHAWHQDIHLDKPIDWIVWAVKAMRPMMLAQDVHMFYCTGRWESSRTDTRDWLKSIGIYFPKDLLTMRPDEDSRRDELVKGEILDKAIRDGAEFQFAFEDRTAVATYLRDRGIPVFHVANNP